ncbi:MAG: phosphopantothenoylcysteine decarboxylase [Candidatus Omnitrophica bacterium]|nr:phosphopantothenoylcysteine decarboxylase [Candidatus Omnitrophota bacterium]
MKRKRLNILVTAGATREKIDPVRFISNYATGYFGFQIAKEAKKRGHRVIVIAGATTQARPRDIKAIDVQTSAQMKRQIEQKFTWSDCLIMNAAVCDFRPGKTAKKKIKREAQKALHISLQKNPDILKSFSSKKGARMMVGFALESENLEKNARAKLRDKNLDLIVATSIKSGSYPFGQAKISSLLIDKNGLTRMVRQATKARLSRILLDNIEKTMIN